VLGVGLFHSRATLSFLIAWTIALGGELVMALPSGQGHAFVRD